MDKEQCKLLMQMINLAYKLDGESIYKGVSEAAQEVLVSKDANIDFAELAEQLETLLLVLFTDDAINLGDVKKYLIEWCGYEK